MSSIKNVALSGATGWLGPTILQVLTDNGFHMTLLTRRGSSSAGHFKSSKGVSIVEVDYQDVIELTKALQGIDAVVCTVGNPGLESQIPLIDAAVAAGIRRFIPSEFGSDPEQKNNKMLPFYQRKQNILDHLKAKAAENPGFSYTRVTTHAFFDWGIRERFLADAKTHSITVYNGGNTPFSVTTLSTVGKAIVAILKNLKATENCPIFIHDAAITQNQLIRIAKEADGIEWTVKEGDTKKLLQDSFEELKKPHPSVVKAEGGFVFVAVYDEDHEPDLTDRLNNQLLGLPVMNDLEVAEVIKNEMLRAQ